MASRPEMKEEDESGFCKFFRNLAEKNDETIRIFDRGDYYSAHGDDAKFIADTVRNGRRSTAGCHILTARRFTRRMRCSGSLVESQG
jgi:DNA mismatch repair ATPase MutS